MRWDGQSAVLPHFISSYKAPFVAKQQNAFCDAAV
jgi:hypothetical protein